MSDVKTNNDIQIKNEIISIFAKKAINEVLRSNIYYGLVLLFECDKENSWHKIKWYI